ncbi:MAG: sugar porter family MFS transporter [Silvibacterium sp.]
MSSPVIQSTGKLNTPDVSKRYVSIIAAVAAFSGLLFGFDTAVINGAIVFLRKQFGLTNFQTEMAASALLLGCLFGASIAGSLSDRFGRRKILAAAGVLFAASAIGAAASQNLATFSTMRLIGGLAIGFASTLTPIYISEIAPPRNRGSLVSMNQLAIVLGILVAYLSNWGLSSLGDSSWRWMFAVGAIPSLAFLVGLIFIPESPRWLLLKGHRPEAQAIMMRVAGEAGAQVELDAIELAAEVEKVNSKELLAPNMRKRLFIAVALAVLQQISGINTVLYYGSVIMRDHMKGQAGADAIGANVVVGLVNLIGTIIAMFFIDRWGRRALLLLASGGMTACLVALSLALRLPAVPIAFAFASVLFYVAFFAVGLGPGVWVYITEIFPTELRSRATSMAISALWASCLAVTLTFLSIVHALGISSTFLIYALLSFMTFSFVWKFVPETRGKSLEDIQNIWGERQ